MKATATTDVLLELLEAVEAVEAQEENYPDS